MYFFQPSCARDTVVCMYFLQYSEKPVSKDHCFGRPPVLKDLIFVQTCPSFYMWESSQFSMQLNLLPKTRFERHFMDNHAVFHTTGSTVQVMITIPCYVTCRLKTQALRLVIYIFSPSERNMWPFFSAGLMPCQQHLLTNCT